MNIKRAKEEIKDTIEAYLYKDEFGSYAIPVIRQRPVLLIGPPGVGKTQIMEQIAMECRIGLVAYTITHHTRQSAVGLPFIEKKSYGGREYSVTEYTMSEIVASIYDKIEATGLREGILFIDEINCVSETLAPTMLQFLQCKSFGNHQIPEGWVIVAAGNPPEYNKSVRDFDVVTLDRIKKILVEPDFDVWKEYAYRQNIHPAILSYLNVKKQNFCQIETTVDGKRFATPRGWEDLSRLIEIYEKLGKKTDREVIVQYIQHPGIAKDFANYLELYYKYENDYQVDQILAGVIKESLCDKVAKAPFDEKLSIVGLLLSRLSGRFRELLTEEAVMERLMGILKAAQRDGTPSDEVREKVTSGVGMPENGTLESGMEVAAKLNEMISETEKEREDLKKKELLSRKEDLVCRKVLRRLETYRISLQEWESGQAAAADAGREAYWNFLREQFGADSDRFEADFDEASQMLEHGFDFMEAAFGDSQEMVIFITELNTSFYCGRFLQEYDCERYYEYNKRLLFDETEQELMAGIR
ncbi:MAG: AAA family ATPase [Lachnospiraceae bacterium]|nr:AAA family ATPase [Lachnospiraceae bacterium]